MATFEIRGTIKLIVGALITAAFYAVLYSFYMYSPMPEGWNIRDMFAEGMLISFAVGAISWIWTRSIAALCIGTVIGIIAGGTWTEIAFSDTNISLFWGTWLYLSGLGLKEILQLFPVVVGWLTAYFIMKRYKIRIVSFKHRVAFLFAGAILAGVLVNFLSPLTEYLSFTALNYKLLRHWEPFLVAVCLLTSLGFSILAGFCFKGSILRKSVFSIITIVLIVLPLNYSTQLADKIRHDGLIALIEHIEPLITAIDSFHVNEHKLPDSLDALVPKYLPKLPDTKSGTYSDYKYEPKHQMSSYSLDIWTSAGIFESFEYLEYSSDGRHIWCEKYIPIEEWIHCKY